MTSLHPPTPLPKPIFYPDSDGEPMSDNSIQFTWIAILKWNAEGQFRNNPDVFVAGDHLIYAVEGSNTIRQAPDMYVAFGPKKHDRGSYKVWEEHGIFPQVVFEVWSPHNRYERMVKKFEFYERYGAEEYYIVYPEFPSYLEGWTRVGNKLVMIPSMDKFVSPRLGWTFHSNEGEISVDGRDGKPLRDPTEIIAELEQVESRAVRLAAKLRELGIDPNAL